MYHSTFKQDFYCSGMLKIVLTSYYDVLELCLHSSMKYDCQFQAIFVFSLHRSVVMYIELLIFLFRVNNVIKLFEEIQTSPKLKQHHSSLKSNNQFYSFVKIPIVKPFQTSEKQYSISSIWQIYISTKVFYNFEKWKETLESLACRFVGSPSQLSSRNWFKIHRIASQLHVVPLCFDHLLLLFKLRDQLKF